MRKILSLVLTLLMVFSVVPVVMVSAAEVTTYLDSSQVGVTWAQKVWSSSLSNGVAGDYETDGFTKKLTTTRSNQGMIMVQFPVSVFDEANLLNIKIAMTAETKIETKSFTAFFYKQGQNAGFDQRNTADNSVHCKYGAYVTLSENTQKVFTITPEKYPGVFENKLSVFCICPSAQGSTSAPVYVDYVSYTVDQLGEEYTVTVDGVEAEKVYDGKTFTVPTPAEGYHYTDGTTDYFGGEEITVTGNVDLVSEINTYDVTVDGVVADTVEHGGTFTVPTPAEGYDYTDGTNTYVGGEVITVTAPVAITSTIKTTKVVYTMDEGSQMESVFTYGVKEGGTYGYHDYINIGTEEQPNYVLKMATRGDQYSYFKLPENWAVKPGYKPVNLSFQMWRPHAGSFYLKAGVDLSLSTSTTSEGGASGDVKVIQEIDSSWWLGTSPTTFSTDVSADMADYKYVSWASAGGNSTSSANGDIWLYIDNVTVTFEYDPEYVAPTYYDVTIDGEVVATVEEGETFVLPAAPEGKQYVDGYTAGQEFVVTSDLAFTTEDIPVVAPVVAITMVKGAGLRFNEAIGMRYRATVDAAAVAAYEAEGYTVTMGTLISPADIIGSFDALTFEADENNYLDVVTDGYYATSENEIAGSIVNIKETNVGRNYIARSYVKLEKDGEVYVSYATENDNSRSVKFLANAVIDNDALPANTAQVALIEKWAAAADWKK